MEPNQGYKSAIIFLLPWLIKQGLLGGQILNFIADKVYCRDPNKINFLTNMKYTTNIIFTGL